MSDLSVGYHDLTWPKLTKEFYLYAKGNPEWNDIIHLFEGLVSSSVELKSNSDDMGAAAEDEYRDEYIPPVVENLVGLSFSEEKAKEFEDKVNIAFEILGFEVIKYGQGTGRNPDGIAIDRENNYAILIDAKSRSDCYKIGTEDRKFIEYIETYRPLLKKDGIKNSIFW